VWVVVSVAQLRSWPADGQRLKEVLGRADKKAFIRAKASGKHQAGLYHRIANGAGKRPSPLAFFTALKAPVDRNDICRSL